MCPSIRRSHPPKPRMFFAVLFLTAISSTILATETPKVILRKTISERNRIDLENNLRLITGWRELHFTSDGELALGASRPVGGSKTAREMLKKAAVGERIILFEDATGRKDIAFCRVGFGTLNKGVREETVFVVLIDFADFRQVSGDRQARAAFNVGWAVLHEIDHAVEDSTDPELDGVSGDCEAHINIMRQELGLPVRTDYYFSLLPVRSDSSFVSRFVRLGFRSRDQLTGRTSRYWLMWDAAVVGGLPSDVQTASFF